MNDARGGFRIMVHQNQVGRVVVVNGTAQQVSPTTTERPRLARRLGERLDDDRSDERRQG